MGKIVNVNDVPQIMRSSTYDTDIEQALKMGKDQALKVEIPSGRKAMNVGMALAQRIRTLKHDEELHVSRVKNEVYILHGAMRKVKSKRK